jgi:hypothetical protein
MARGKESRRDFGPLPSDLSEALEEVRYWREMWAGLFAPLTNAPVKLTKTHAMLFNVLEAAQEQPVPFARLLQAMYAGRDEPDWADGTLKVQIGRLRVKLAETEWRIVSVWGYGYQMVKNDRLPVRPQAGPSPLLHPSSPSTTGALQG